jgi:transcriptional regulator with XRE-family HTH domain
MTGEELKYKRKQLKLTQDELAKLLGVSKNTVFNWEKGKRIPESKTFILEQVLNNNKQPAAFDIKLSDEERIQLFFNEIESEVLLEELLKKFHPLEIINFIHKHREKFMEYEEFAMLMSNVERDREIEDLKEQIKNINARLDGMNK